MAGNGRITAEIAGLEGISGIANLLQHAPLGRVVFDPHFPFFVGESTALKLQELELADVQQAAIERGNAQRLIQS